MKNKRLRKSKYKAASAALAILSLTQLTAAAQDYSTPRPLWEAWPETLPALPDEEGQYEELIRAFQADEAEAPFLMEKFLKDYPVSRHRDAVTLMMADRLFYNKEYPLAFVYYSRLNDDAFSGDIREGMLYRKAYTMLKIGYHSEAAYYFSILSSSPEYGDSSQFYLAYIDYVNEKYDNAYKAFQQLKNRGVKSDEAEYYLNQIDYLRGEYQKVASTSERLLIGNVPAEMKAETMRVGGLSAHKTGNTAAARDLLTQYEELTKDGAELTALYTLATLYYDEGNYKEAARLFSIVANADNREISQSAWLYLGQIHMSQGKTREAAQEFARAADMSWDNDVAETAAYNFAVTTTEGSSLPFSKAAEGIEKFIETYPFSPHANSLSKYLANAYYNKQEYAQALALVDKISRPDDSTKAMRQKILYQLGASQLRHDDPDSAIKTLAEASASDSPDKEVAAQAALWLGDAYYMKEDYGNAAKAYTRALSSGLLGDNSAIGRYNLGYAYLKQEDFQKAENAFKEAMMTPGLDSDQSLDAKLRYADALYYNAKYNDALTQLRDVKKKGGSEAVYASVREADILGRQGKTSEKITILESLLDNKDLGMWKGTVQSRLADAYTEKGDDKKAAEIYAAMIDGGATGSDATQAYYAIAMNAENLYDSGDLPAALAAYKKVEESGIATLYPDAVTGIMRASADNKEIAAYAAKVIALPGISAYTRNEAILRGAKAGIALGGDKKTKAMDDLEELARSTDRFWGAQAAVIEGEELTKEGNLTGAEEILLYLIDNGSDDNYWLARGYIALADVYIAKEDNYLARLYLETLRDNYPGKEKDIQEMITKRLNTLN